MHELINKVFDSLRKSGLHIIEDGKHKTIVHITDKKGAGWVHINYITFLEENPGKKESELEEILLNKWWESKNEREVIQQQIKQEQKKFLTFYEDNYESE